MDILPNVHVLLGEGERKGVLAIADRKAIGALKQSFIMNFLN
jgi:hypothetical protein